MHHRPFLPRFACAAFVSALARSAALRSVAAYFSGEYLLCSDTMLSCFSSVSEYQAMWDEMMTKGTRGNNDYTHWISRICRIGADLHEFQRNANWMLSTYFDKLTSHRREDYIDAFARFREDIRDAKLVDLDDDDQPYLFGDPSPYSFRFDFPAHISFIPYHDEKTGKPKLAERSTFDDLVSFYYLDLTRGLAAGNLPRRCKNCGHWFVAVGGYNIQYCDRPILGQGGKSYSSAGYTTEHLRGVVTSRHFSLQNTNECVIRSKRTCLSHTTVIL